MREPTGGAPFHEPCVAATYAFTTSTPLRPALTALARFDGGADNVHQVDAVLDSASTGNLSERPDLTTRATLLRSPRLSPAQLRLVRAATRGELGPCVSP